MDKTIKLDGEPKPTQLDSNHIMMMMAIREERKRQIEKWGVQRHPHGTGLTAAGAIMEQWKQICDSNNAAGMDDWLTIAAEEFFEVAAETDKRKLFDEVVQAAAVFTAWGEAIIEEIKRENGL